MSGDMDTRRWTIKSLMNRTTLGAYGPFLKAFGPEMPEDEEIAVVPEQRAVQAETEREEWRQIAIDARMAAHKILAEKFGGEGKFGMGALEVSSAACAEASAKAQRAESECLSLRREVEQLREAIDALDLSDDYTLTEAKPGELVSCTRPVELWIELRRALSASRSEAQTPDGS